jgi:hypothetical protein
VVPEHDNIVGIGYGPRSGIGVSGEIAIRVYVRRKLARRELPSPQVVPPTVNGLPTDVIPVGDLRAFGRPTKCGVSIGHYRIGAGTLGCLVKPREGESDQLFVLSNNHVLANTNDAKPGDPILEPGPADGGDDSKPIAELTDFEPVNYAGVNLIDAAIARVLDPSEVTPDIFDIGHLVPPIMTAVSYQSVRKRGRTTYHTVGIVSDLAADIRVRYERKFCDFEDQLGIDGIGQRFSAEGDSGSLVVDAITRRPVGLVFAGGSVDVGPTFANPIGEILERFRVEPVYGDD